MTWCLWDLQRFDNLVPRSVPSSLAVWSQGVGTCTSRVSLFGRREMVNTWFWGLIDSAHHRLIIGDRYAKSRYSNMQTALIIGWSSSLDLTQQLINLTITYLNGCTVECVCNTSRYENLNSLPSAQMAVARPWSFTMECQIKHHGHHKQSVHPLPFMHLALIENLSGTMIALLTTVDIIKRNPLAALHADGTH
eukprot:238681-Pelagomonas_calceolata.AAC.2